MKPPRLYSSGILHFFSGIRRSTYLAYSAEAASAAKAGRQGYGRSVTRIHSRARARGIQRRRIRKKPAHPNSEGKGDWPILNPLITSTKLILLFLHTASEERSESCLTRQGNRDHLPT